MIWGDYLKKKRTKKNLKRIFWMSKESQTNLRQYLKKLAMKNLIQERTTHF